jgi:hypothetical protein
MPMSLSVRQVPWTCRWGRFGGPVEQPGSGAAGFVFWVCAHPEISPRLLERGSCEHCPHWEPAEGYDRRTA